MNMHFIIAIGCCLLLSSCQQKKDLGSAEKKQIEDSVHQTLERYNNAVREKGLNAEFAFLDSSADFFWVPPGYTTPLSYDSVAAIVHRNANSFRSVDNQFTSILIHPLSSDFCNYTATIRSVIADTSGKKSEFNLIETGLMVRRDDGWKLLSGQTGLIPAK
jgi:hypothetical protein